MGFIADQEWRYATKKFDSSKKVSSSDLDKIKRAVQLAPTSYGLQLFKVLVIENEETREKLKPASWGQTQITDASHLLVFCTPDDVYDAHLDDFVQLKADNLGIPAENLKGYGDFIKGKMAELSKEEKQVWMSKQTYIALGNLMSMCAELKIDACPMEGFEKASYDEILNLSEKNLTSSVVVTIGYRSDEDTTKDAPKTRRAVSDLFEVV